MNYLNCESINTIDPNILGFMNWKLLSGRNELKTPDEQFKYWIKWSRAKSQRKTAQAHEAEDIERRDMNTDTTDVVYVYSIGTHFLHSTLTVLNKSVELSVLSSSKGLNSKHVLRIALRWFVLECSCLHTSVWSVCYARTVPGKFSLNSWL